MVDPGPTSPKEKSPKQMYVPFASIPFQPGKAYRLTAWLKAEGDATRVALSAFSWKKDSHNWSAQTTVSLTREWLPYEFLFRLPRAGESDYKPAMDTLGCRLVVVVGTDVFWVDDLSLREADLRDEWEGWQARGMDQHSLVANPLFVDAERGNYRLQPQSPAFGLGFEPIPVDKIGPYKDPLRASWPIIEAVGARD
jgi:hypothetical protein